MSEYGMNCGEATLGPKKGRRGWRGFRILLFLAGLSLVGYVGYRYSFFQPPDHGSLYGTIFPLSLLLAVVGMVLAFQPYALARVPGQAGMALRSGLTVYGGAWMATGLMCASSLAKGMAEVPLGGSIDMLHMLFQHVFLPVAVVALAWAPERVGRWLGAREEHPIAAAEPAFGAGF
jgi:hypothetical protein